jgi:peptide chain release factor 2
LKNINPKEKKSGNESMTFGGIFDIDKKKTEIASFEEKTQAPGFWDDNIEAQKVMQEITLRKEWVDLYETVDAKTEDYTAIVDLAEESKEEGMESEIQPELAALEKLLGDLEFKNMLSGEDDQRPAIITIHSGAGGTESQDWA